MRDFLLANKDQIKFYNNIHSYSQLILLPWGWGYDLPDNIDDLTRVTRPHLLTLLLHPLLTSHLPAGKPWP